MPYHLYILRCSDNSLYTGITPDLEARLEKHASGKGSKYVRSRLPFECVYTEVYSSKSEALKREMEVKALNKQEKEHLISRNKT